MHLVVLHIDDCPSWVEAGRRLQDALRACGFHETEIVYRRVNGPEDAERVLFAGSPTILRDGEDLFPGNGRTSNLACRVYATPTGPAGLPTTEQLIDAIDSRER